METAKVDKVIITNQSELIAKYGTDDTNKIISAVQALIAADQKRGLISQLHLLDDATNMKDVNASPVTMASDPKQNKEAIDAIYKALVPDYLMLLGATDIIPHQALNNPLYSSVNDPDEFAFGDLPYACEAPYSQKPEDFYGPTRVVGRLPDITGVKDPVYILNLLSNAASYKEINANQYRDFFGISAEIWKNSSELSVTNTFSTKSNLETIPPSSANWPSPLLGKLSHFINCHGAPNNSSFYGQPANGDRDYPVALNAVTLKNAVMTGTVVAAECCYGAQLFNPFSNAGNKGISNTYLENGAYGFFGSTTIAYGPSEGNDSADLICQFFLQSVLRGASLGRAALEARQKFIHSASMSDPDNVKTIAQFNIYADPSLTPVTTSEVSSKSMTVQDATSERVMRAERRRDLYSRGTALSKSQPIISKYFGEVPDSTIKSIQQRLRDSGLESGEIISFNIKASANSKSMPPGLFIKEEFPSRVHVIFHAGNNPSKDLSRTGSNVSGMSSPVSEVVALIVKEIDGSIVTAKKTFRR